MPCKSSVLVYGMPVIWYCLDLKYLQMISFVIVCTYDEALEISFTKYACTDPSFPHLYILFFHMLIWFYLLSTGDCSKASLFNQVVHWGRVNRGFFPPLFLSKQLHICIKCQARKVWGNSGNGVGEEVAWLSDAVPVSLHSVLPPLVSSVSLLWFLICHHHLYMSWE